MKTLLIGVLLTLTVGIAGCAGKARHTAVVADTALYEALNDIHTAEQAALDIHLPGWTLEKSQAFNKKLLPAVEGGRQFNAALKTWKPGTPLPDAVKTEIGAIGDALTAVLADFPVSPQRDRLLDDVAKANLIALNTLRLVLEVQSGR